jgi:hypothetical protein
MNIISEIKIAWTILCETVSVFKSWYVFQRKAHLVSKALDSVGGRQMLAEAMVRNEI